MNPSATPIGRVVPPLRDALPAAAMAGFVVLYALLDWVSYVHPMRGTNITPWNPQAALAVALLTRHPRCWWLVAATMGGMALLRALPAFAAADLAASLMLALGYAATAAALRRWLGPLPRVATRNDYLLFLLIVAAGAAINTGLYVGTLATFGFGGSDRVGLALLRSWTGDAVSLIVSMPVIFALADNVRRTETLAMGRTVEWWLVAGCAMAVALLVFGRPAEEQFKFFYLLFLPVAWGAARFGNVGAVWSSALVQGLLILAVKATPYQPLTVFELHMLMTALGATGLLLGATVHERQQAEQALRASLHAAAAADMAAALAHELHQPLTAMRSYARSAQLLADRIESSGAADAGALREVAGRLVDEVARAGAVVRRLRDFFRAGGTELQREDPRPLVEEVVQSHAMRAQGAGVDLVLQCEDRLPPVWIDRVQIEVVLRNLVSNALDAAAEGVPGQVVVRARRIDQQLELAVLDSGPGIPAEDLPGVFESRRSSKPGGMGIGLAISRSIVEAHDGRLWAEAGPGGRFFFSLPVAQQEDRHA